MFLAKLFGAVYVAVGLGMLFSPKYYSKAVKEMVKEYGMMYFGGAVALVVGLAIVLHHNVWQGWPILVTVLGWAALVKGFALLIFPEWMSKFTKHFFKSAESLGWWGFFVLTLGLLFSYFGWLA